MNNLSVGIDVGGTFTKMGLVDPQGRGSAFSPDPDRALQRSRQFRPPRSGDLEGLVFSIRRPGPGRRRGCRDRSLFYSLPT